MISQEAQFGGPCAVLLSKHQCRDNRRWRNFEKIAEISSRELNVEQKKCDSTRQHQVSALAASLMGTVFQRAQKNIQCSLNCQRTMRPGIRLCAIALSASD